MRFKGCKSRKLGHCLLGRFGRPIRGFTLVEVLLASIIGSLVAVVAFATFRSVTHSRQMVDYYSQAMAHGRYGLNLIRDDLANFYRSSDPDEMSVEGVKGKLNDRPADRLIMYVVSDRKIKADRSEGDVYEVEYGLGYSKEKNEYFLTRRCGAVEDIKTGNAKGELRRVASYISELKFEYYYGRQWLRQWYQRGAVPEMVRISMQLVDPKGERPTLAMSQVIGFGPLPDTDRIIKETGTIDVDRKNKTESPN